MFYFDYSDSKHYRIESQNIQTVYQDNEILQSDTNIQNTIRIRILQRTEDSIVIQGSTEQVEQGLLIAETNYQYSITPQGIYMEPENEGPTFIQNIPVFPRHELNLQDTWRGSSKEFLSIPLLDVKIPLLMQVNYTFEGYSSIPRDYLDENAVTTRPYPVFHARYGVKEHLYEHAPLYELPTHLRINADFELLLWWNEEHMRPEYYFETYLISFHYTAGAKETTVTVEGEVNSQLIPVPDAETKRVEQRLRESLSQDNEDIALQQDERGLKILLRHVLFKPNSAEPLESIERTLQPVVAALKQEAERRILIEGHTALAGTKVMQKKLSETRAKVIRDYLQEQLGWESELFLYRGWGSEIPRASNKTEEGRKKNRRVEITILEN